MRLLEMPLVIVRDVLEYAVATMGIREALRLRLVDSKTTLKSGLARTTAYDSRILRRRSNKVLGEIQDDGIAESI